MPSCRRGWASSFAQNSSRKLLDCCGYGGWFRSSSSGCSTGLQLSAASGVGLLFAAAAKPNAGLLVNALVTGGVLFGAVLFAAFYLSGNSRTALPASPSCADRRPAF
jgi:hypothetical protein